MRRPPAGLVALLVVAALESLAWSLLVPALQGPDESAHASRVARIADDGVFLPDTETDDGLSRELLLLAAEAGLGPLAGNLGARPAWTALDEARWRERARELGSRAGDVVVDVPEGPPVRGGNRYPPLYYAWAAGPWAAAGDAPLPARLELARLANLPFLLAAVVFTWLLAAELLPATPWARPLAAGIVALEPQLAFLSGTINPDPALVTLTAATTLVGVRTVRAGPSAARLALLAGLCVLAVLAHPRGVVLFGLAALAVALGARHRYGARALLVAAGLLVAGLAAVLVLSQATSVPALGGLASENDNPPFSPRRFASYLWQFYLPALPGLQPPVGGDHGFREVWVQSFFGTFGSLEILFPDWVYDVLQAVVLALAAACLAALVRLRRSVRRRWDAAVLLGALALGLVGGLHLFAYRTLVVDPSDPILVGRHLLPLLPLVAVGAAVAGRLLPARAGPYYAAALLAGLVLLQLGGLGLTLTRYYV